MTLLPIQRKHKHNLIFKNLFSKVLTAINAVTVLVGNISHDLAAATCYVYILNLQGYISRGKQSGTSY